MVAGGIRGTHQRTRRAESPLHRTCVQLKTSDSRQRAQLLSEQHLLPAATDLWLEIAVPATAQFWAHPAGARLQIFCEVMYTGGGDVQGSNVPTLSACKSLRRPVGPGCSHTLDRRSLHWHAPPIKTGCCTACQCAASQTASRHAAT